jgi:ribulose 1,5-bisphosphate synthetase/thiazole synthase
VRTESLSVCVSESANARLKNRMGASFGGMFSSGIKAAKEAIRIFEESRIVDGKVVG